MTFAGCGAFSGVRFAGTDGAATIRPECASKVRIDSSTQNHSLHVGVHCFKAFKNHPQRRTLHVDTRAKRQGKDPLLILSDLLVVLCYSRGRIWDKAQPPQIEIDLRLPAKFVRLEAANVVLIATVEIPCARGSVCEYNVSSNNVGPGSPSDSSVFSVGLTVASSWPSEPSSSEQNSHIG
jgi:hypothetical protein